MRPRAVYWGLILLGRNYTLGIIAVAVFPNKVLHPQGTSLLSGALTDIQQLERANTKERLVFVHVSGSVAKAQDIKCIPSSTDQVFVVEADALWISKYFESANYVIDRTLLQEGVKVCLVAAGY